MKVPRVKLGVWGIVLAVCLVGTARAGGNTASLELLRRPVNGAISPSAGQGLDMLHGAEPLGKGRFRLHALNGSQQIALAELGSGNAYTGTYSLAYGVTPTLEASLSLPFLIDSAGGLNKYGTSDPVVGIKLSRPGKIPSSFYTAYQLLFSLPLGYKGEHGLDEYGGVRRFSNESVDMGLQMLVDMHFRYASFYFNGGYFRSGNPEILPELVYGAGTELGRGSRWFSLNAEYWTRVAIAEESRVVGALKFGARFSVYPGFDIELNREYGFLDHPSDGLFTFGLRLHGYLTGRRRLEGRYTLYKPPRPPRRLYQPAQVLRIALVDFDGFEDFMAGERLVEKIKTQLAPHDSLEIVDLKRYEDIPHKGFLKSNQAVDLARKLGVDVVVTGQVEAYEVDRFAGPLIPFLVNLPESRVKVELRYRVLEFSPDKTEMQGFIDQVAGQSRLLKRPRLLPPDERDITTSASARELNDAQERALEDLVDNMLASMAVQFAWVPPDFLP